MGIKDKIKNNRSLYYIIRCIKNIRNQEFVNNVLGVNNNPNLLRITHNGSLYPRKIIYYIEHEDKRAGFGAILFKTLGAINFADQLGMIPVVRWGKLAYYDSDMDKVTTNVFEYYYQQPTDVTVDDVFKANNVVTNQSRNDYLFLRDGFSISDVDDHYMWNIVRFKEMAVMMKKYIRLNTCVEENIFADISGLGITDKTLGVQIRRVMFQYNVKDHPYGIGLDEYIHSVKKMWETGKYDKVFLATEEMESLVKMQQEFGEHLVYYKDIYRNDIGDTFISVTSERKYHHYLQGYEVLRDMYTLANCRALVTGLTNVSFCAKIIKLSIDDDYEDECILDKGIAKNGMNGRDFYKMWNKKLK